MIQVAIIGAGALGSALARALHARGYPVRLVVSRTRERAERLAATIGAEASDDVAAAASGVDLVFCCVPDDAIPAVAAALGRVRAGWDGVVAAHTSGALAASALEPLGAQGAALLSFHPAQTFPPESPPGAFEGITVALEGDARAVEVGRRVAADLGARSVLLPSEAKARYHLAASLASNFTVTLAAVAEEILYSGGIPPEEARALLAPLLEATVRNVARQGPEQALTGPIVREDGGTVGKHLDELEAHAPHLLQLYTALAEETVRVARRSGRLSEEGAAALLRIIGEER